MLIANGFPEYSLPVVFKSTKVVFAVGIVVLVEGIKSSDFFPVSTGIVAIICCFTPFLAIALPAVGLGGLLAYVYNDLVLLPALAIFLAVAVYGIWRGNPA